MVWRFQCLNTFNRPRNMATTATPPARLAACHMHCGLRVLPRNHRKRAPKAAVLHAINLAQTCSDFGTWELLWYETMDINQPNMEDSPGKSTIEEAAAPQQQGHVISCQEQEPQCVLRLLAGASCLASVDKRERGGEDAYLMLPQHGLLAVADGVGGWGEMGVDPALYSRGLMSCCQEALQAASTPAAREPRKLLQAAQVANHVEGSATACLALVRPSGVLQVANVGDSGLRVLRDGEILLKTRPQQRRFNQPFQLAHPSIQRRTNTAERDSDRYEVQLQHGDILILATDGLFDNVDDAQLIRLAYTLRPITVEGAQRLAQELTQAAHRRAQDPNAVTPWCLAAIEAGVADTFGYVGGKMDDCTVVVAFAQAVR